jgi:peptidyl-prolyl cis-trans isomerase D
MLEALFRGAIKFLATALFAILLLSFALWGIPNFSRDGTRVALAKVGETEIWAEDFTAALNNQRQAMSRQFNANITPEQARAFGLDQQVLADLISGAAVTEHARLMGLRVSDAFIAEQVRSNPAFQGADKKFSKSLFEAQIRQFGLTEQRYFAEAREATVREQVTQGLAEGLHVNSVLVDVAHRFREESRTIALFAVDPAKVAKPAAPDEAKLKELFERIKGQFKSPETRKIAVLFLTRDDIKARVKVEDGEVKAAWEKDKTAWDIPERRKFHILAFKDKAAAAAAAKEIAGGKSLLMVALETGAQSRLDQGFLARREVGDARIAKAAFELPVGKISDPVETRNGFMLLRVTAIEPGKSRALEEVAKEIRDGLEQSRLTEIEKQLREQIEDRRGQRQPFASIGEQLKLKVVEVVSVDRNGLGADRKAALDHPDARRIIAAAFEGDKAAVREPLTLTGGGEAWVEVADVTPEKQKAFEEVKADVTAIAIESEHLKAVQAVAEGLIERVKKGEPLEAVAKSQGAKVETSQPFKRIAPTPLLPASGARLAFSLPNGGAATVEKPEGKQRLVFVVTDVKPAAAPTKEEAEKLAEQLRQQLQSDVLASYVTALRDRLGLTVNQAVYERAVGIERRK